MICTAGAGCALLRAAPAFMHAACFDAFEEAAAAQAARNSGMASAASYGDRNRLWATKRGLEMAFPACECACRQGSLRKDLDWVPPRPGQQQQNPQGHQHQHQAMAMVMAMDQDASGQCTQWETVSAICYY